MKKNYMLLKAILTDGHYTSEDFLMVECKDGSPDPTPVLTPTPTPLVPNNIELNLSNNWTHRVNDFLVIKFIPTLSNSQYVIRVPKLSDELLPQPGQPAPIPSSASLNINSNKIGDLLFISSYFNKNITLVDNSNVYTSTINIGQIIF